MAAGEFFVFVGTYTVVPFKVDQRTGELHATGNVATCPSPPA